MTSFLAYADRFGSAIHIIGTALALFFIALILSEAALRTRRQRRSEQRLRESVDTTIASANKTRVVL